MGQAEKGAWIGSSPFKPAHNARLILSMTADAQRGLGGEAPSYGADRRPVEGATGGPDFALRAGIG